MRKLLMAVVTLISTGIFAATGANAAATWSCDGAEYVCGSPASSKTSSSKASRSAPVDDANETRPTRTKAAKARPSQETASNDDSVRPTKSRRNRPASNDDNSGGSTYSGAASYYWQPQKLASGGYFNPNAMTAAHKTLPFGTRVRVTNQRNGQSVDVVINDRGPYVAGRIIDLSKAAAQSINMTGAGVVPVSVKVLGRG